MEDAVRPEISKWCQELLWPYECVQYHKGEGHLRTKVKRKKKSFNAAFFYELYKVFKHKNRMKNLTASVVQTARCQAILYMGSI